MTSRNERPAALRPSDRQILDALRRHGELDRAEAARLSGMPRSTVTDSIGRLVQHGLVVERVKPAEARTGAGRPASLLALAPPAGVVGVVLLTHEALHAGVLGFDGALFSQQALEPQPFDPADSVAEPARALLTKALAGAGHSLADLACVVIGLPLPVDPGQSGPRSELASPRIPPDPADELSQALGIPVLTENDANLAALGEGALGAGKAMSSLVYLKIAGGIGAGLVLDRRLHRGANGLAGELAHLQVDGDGDGDGAVCRCGGRGCLQTIFNARHLDDRIAAIRPPAESTAEVLALAAAADSGVCQQLREFGRLLGRSLADLSVYLAPDGVIIDGALPDVVTCPVIDGIEESLHQCAPPAIAASVQVVAGTLAGNAELHGAAVLARLEIFGHDLLLSARAG